MRVSTNVLAFIGAATLAAASPTPAVNVDFVGPVTGGVETNVTDVAIRIEVSEVLQKRAVANPVLTAAARTAIRGVIKATKKLIRHIANWDEDRADFIKNTVSEMAAHNPDPSKYAATVCYNMRYDLQNPNGMDGKVSVSFSSGPLHTNYDCFYMTRPNSFWSRGDGGFINLAISYDSRCQFDSKTADLYCA